MGTRADFYVGRGDKLEWVGSIAWDGYPTGLVNGNSAADKASDIALLNAKTEDEYRTLLAAFFSKRHDVTLPDQGWPWPWDDSGTTDYAYTFDAGCVYGTRGKAWWKATEDPDEEDGLGIKWPNMKASKKTTFGKRSGLIVIG